MTHEAEEEWAAFRSSAWAANERAIGARVRALREEKGWTSEAVQSRLDEAGLAVRLDDVEAGVSALTVTTLHMLCFLWQVKAHDVLPSRTWEPAPEVVDARASVRDPLVEVVEWARAQPASTTRLRVIVKPQESGDAGWLVDIDTSGTPMASRTFNEVEHEPSATEFMVASLAGGHYTAMTSPGGLLDAFAVFCRWTQEDPQLRQP